MSNTSNKLLLDGGSKEPPKPNQPGGTSTDAASSPSTADEEERLRNWNLLGVAAPDFKPLSEMVSPLGQVAGSRSVTELARSTQNAGENTANLASLTIAQAQNQAQSAKGSDGVAAPAPTTGNDQSDPRNAKDRWFDDPKYRPAATTDGQPVPQTAGGEAGIVNQSPPQGAAGQDIRPQPQTGAGQLEVQPVEQTGFGQQGIQPVPKVGAGQLETPQQLPQTGAVQLDSQPSAARSGGFAPSFTDNAPAMVEPTVVQKPAGEEVRPPVQQLRPPADQVRPPADQVSQPVDKITTSTALDTGFAPPFVAPDRGLVTAPPDRLVAPLLPPKSQSDIIPPQLSDRTFSAGRSLSVDSKDMLTPWRVPVTNDAGVPRTAVKSELSPVLTLGAVQTRPAVDAVLPVKIPVKDAALKPSDLKGAEPVLPSRLTLSTVSLTTKAGELRAPLLTDTRKPTSVSLIDRAPLVVRPEIKSGTPRTLVANALTANDRTDRVKPVVIKAESAVRVDAGKLVGNRVDTRLDTRQTALRVEKTIPVLVTPVKTVRLDATRLPTERLGMKPALTAGERPVALRADHLIAANKVGSKAINISAARADLLIAKPNGVKSETARAERFIVKPSSALKSDRPVVRADRQVVVKPESLRADRLVVKPATRSESVRAERFVVKPAALKADKSVVRSDRPIALKAETLRTDRPVVKPAIIRADVLRTDRLVVKPSITRADVSRSDRPIVKPALRPDALRADRPIPARDFGARNTGPKADLIRPLLPVKAEAVRALKLDTAKLQPTQNLKNIRPERQICRTDSPLTNRTFKATHRDTDQSREFKATVKVHERAQERAQFAVHLKANPLGSRHDGRAEGRVDAQRFAVSAGENQTQKGIKFGEIRRSFSDRGKVLAREGDDRSLASSIEQRLLAARMDYLVQAIEERSCAEDRYLTSLELLLGCLLTMAAVGKRSERSIAPRGQDIDAAMTLVLKEAEDSLRESSKSLRIESEQSQQDASGKVLVRPIHMMSRGDTLTGLAEQYFGDERLGWLILELNAGKLRPQWNGDTCLTEATERLRIELPVSQDIQEFRSNSLSRYTGKRLLTYVRESGIDRELTLSNFKNSLSAGSKRGWRMTVMQAQST